jgi:phage FluMu protein Com
MDTKLTEFRCPQCPPIVRGALLFKGVGNALIEIKCPKCGRLVTIEINNGIIDYATAKEMAKANN